MCPYNAISFQPVPGLRNAAPVVIENKCSGCGWVRTSARCKGLQLFRVNVIGEIRLASGSYIEKRVNMG